MKRSNRKKELRTNNGLTVAGACLGMMVTGGLAAHAQSTVDADKVAALEKQNQSLQERLGTL